MPIQQWPSNNPPATPPHHGARTPRGRGRGRGQGSPAPFNVFFNQKRGLGSPRGRGQGRGDDRDPAFLPYGRGRNLSSKLSAGAPLSKLLYEDRPLLRPVKFVRSVYTATLFQQEEDILQPVVEAAVDGDEQSHIPTADAVFRVFHPLDPEPQAEGSDGDDSEGQLEEIDFADIGKIQAAVDAAAARQTAVLSKVAIVKEQTASFFVDTTPADISLKQHTPEIRTNRLDGGALGETVSDDDEEIIVYVAPHPRNGKSTTPLQSTSRFTDVSSSTSILTGLQIGSNVHSVSQGDQAEAPMNVPSSSQVKPAELQSGFALELGTLYPEGPPPASESVETTSAPDPEQLPPPPLFGSAATPDQQASVASPSTPAPAFDSVSFSFSQTKTNKQARRLNPVAVRSLRKRKPRRKSLHGFGALGAMHAEEVLHEVDPRRDEQRRGDSDVNWGTTDEEDNVDALSVDMGGMDLDAEISLSAMKSFVHSMSAEGSRHVTMDDVADMERMREEDERVDVRGPESADEDGSDEDVEGGKVGAPDDKVKGSEGGKPSDKTDDEDEEVEAIVRAEEEMFIGESDGEPDEHDGVDEEDDDGDGDDDSSDDEEGFQARLERLRSQHSKDKGKGKARAVDDSSDEEMSIHLTWADEDDEYADHIQELLDEYEHTLGTGNRKARKYMTKAIQNGDFDADFFANMQPAKHGKNKHVPPELREQWEKDRQKKAENKQKRALERMLIAADPMAIHKGGKKGRKAMLAAARAAEDLPNRIVDFVSLEQQIRRFLADIDGRDTMVLPPADKDTRKRVHELATAFNLKSQSKGKGEGRYTTLIKTTKSGIGINEKKIRRIMRQATDGNWEGPSGGGGRSRAVPLSKHREGEEVGKGAAKIDAKNIGFKMLASMGWSDGDRIGLSGGLDAPLTAIMKKTKLGLGAAVTAV
ncbi:hypothetical protein C8Q76DRAFT_639423 [Earliella scabrosa]|nr:hypothetical protein C8Q76DRAFT_639423 [Earliella scabrosa]